MITFFTTFKDFNGKNKVNQLNAIRSWLALKAGVEVIIFSESEGIQSVLKEERVIHVQDIALHEGRIPLIGPMFNRADKLASNNICCFINGDIIVTKKFLSTVQALANKFSRNYLFVGQRDNIDVEEELTFDQNWETIFMERYQKDFEDMPPYAMDYFVFPKGQYQDYAFPTLLVGRPGWDLWMIYNAFKRNLTTVDLSFTVKVIHQNHDYNHKIKNTIIRATEDQINYKAFPFEEFYFFTAQNCNYIYKNNQIQKNYGRDDLELYLRMKLLLSENKLLSKFLILLLSEHSILSNTFTKSIGVNVFNLFIRKSLNQSI